MFKRDRLFMFLGLLLAAGLAACAPKATEPPPEPTTPPPAPEVSITGSATNGGLLYDKWWKAAGVDEPSGDQPLWATQTSNTRSGTATWRCKECHGWDYMGTDGAYGSGSHFTGFPGVYQAGSSLSQAELLAALDGSANSDHDFSAMGDSALADLVIFLSEGLVDVAPHIAEDKSAVGGDVAHGDELYSATCAACHGPDGRAINFGGADDPEYVGTIASGNPWEFIHKVRNGQPGTAMPSSVNSGWSMQDVVDVLAFAQTLPTDAPTATAGGLLYDKWWKAAGVDEPSGDQPLWATQTTNTRSGSSTWRCKECHGWDYMGADGAYGSGSHFTGFPGVFGSADLSLAELVGWLNGSTNADHDFSAMGAESIDALATFLKIGTIDVSPYIAEDKSAVGGDPAAGGDLYTSTCAGCHGADGRAINFHDADDPEYVGTIASGNPWEFIHKVRNGQPGTGMPASVNLGWSMQQVVDVLAYAQSLPTSPATVTTGGLLYDKWWKAAGVDEPAGDQPLWATQTTNTRSGTSTWRCKECHGWDYMGADGAYGSGSHFTGFTGVFASADLSLEDLAAWLDGSTNADHDFSAMGEDSIAALASFLKFGLVDVSPYIAEDKSAIGGDVAAGGESYASNCAACHGDDGRLINFGDADDPEYVGTIATGNPWEYIHKVRAGQPATAMPSGIALGWSMQDVINLLAFGQTLPVEAP